MGVPRDKWFRKSDKRALKAKDKGIVDLVKIIFHFFKDINKWIADIEDPRNESYIIYDQRVFFFILLMKNITSQESMTKMDEWFNEENCTENIEFMTGLKGLEELPHKDTITHYLKGLSDEELSKIRRKMIHSLLRANRFGDARLLDKYWRVIIDGTAIHYYKERPDENAIRQEITNADGTKQTRYYHKVLEAKLVLGEHLLVSIGTEFIENENEDVTKQDCELKAARRLVKRLKKEFPRMPFCIQGDALYANSPFMQLCESYGWKYLFTFKYGAQPSLAEEFRELMYEGDCELSVGVGEEEGYCYFYNRMENLFMDKSHFGNILEYSYHDQREDKRKYFKWITNITITKYNVNSIIGYGRGRWKIENEGFNTQKNGIYQIEHLNSYDYQAIKNHYLFTQIADIIMQLYLSYTCLIVEGIISIKNASLSLLESFRTHLISLKDAEYIARKTSVYLTC